LRKIHLVTGTAGFIGSHVAVALLQRGDMVIGIDNMNDYYNPARKYDNLKVIQNSAKDSDQFAFYQGDIRDLSLLDQIFSRFRFTSIMHLAAMAGVRASIDDPRYYYDVNLLGTLNLLDKARDLQIPNFIFASTSGVYGDTRTIPFVETDNCDRPLAPYPASKRAAEMLGFSYHHLYRQNFTALRFFTVYGPRGRPDMMAYKVLDNIFFGKEVPLYNNGQMHRDWTYVADIVDGILSAVDKPMGYEIINLGRGEPVLLADFVHFIEELSSRKASLKEAPMESADIMYTYADINKARQLLFYEPKVSFQEGVTRFYHWYREAVLEQ
jgi:UDP-glucuronate 4-epimerase